MKLGFRVVSSGGSLPHLCEDVGELFTLPLGANVCAQAPLQELQGPLVAGHLQQLHGALLVGSMPDNLPDEVAHKLGVLGQHLEITKCQHEIRTKIIVVIGLTVEENGF